MGRVVANSSSVNPYIDFWKERISQIEESSGFDLEFGKRFLLALLESDDGLNKFQNFLKRARDKIEISKELRALNFENHEKELFNKLPLGMTLDKFLRTRGWNVYGASCVITGILGFFHSASVLNDQGIGFTNPLEGANTINSLIVYPAAEILIFFLFRHMVMREIEDSKYEELQRVTLQLLNTTHNVTRLLVEETDLERLRY